MRKKQPAHSRQRGQLHHIRVRAVAPMALGRIFLRRVLRFVNHYVRALHVLGVTPVPRFENRLHFSPRRAVPPDFLAEGLVIAQIADGSPFGLDAISQRGRRMVHLLRAHLDAINLVGPFAQILIADPRGQLVQLHWKIVVFHLPGQHIS